MTTAAMATWGSLGGYTVSAVQLTGCASESGSDRSTALTTPSTSTAPRAPHRAVDQAPPPPLADPSGEVRHLKPAAVGSHHRLPMLPVQLGMLHLGKPTPALPCADRFIEDGVATCHVRATATTGPVAEALGAEVVELYAHTDDATGVLIALRVSVPTCTPEDRDPVGAQLLKTLNLSGISRHRPPGTGEVTRTDGTSTTVTLRPDDDARCAVTLSLGNPKRSPSSDATTSDGEISGTGWDRLPSTILDHPIPDLGGDIESALWTASGLWLTARAGTAADGTLKLHHLVLDPSQGAGQTAWRTATPPLPIDTGSWGTSITHTQAPPNSEVSAIGDGWLIVEYDRRLCQSGADTCHVHRSAQAVQVSSPPTVRGHVPVDEVGVYGHETCEGVQFQYSRAVTTAHADTLELQLLPAFTRTLCDANLDDCQPGPRRPVHLTHPIPVRLVINASGAEMQPADLAAIAGELALRPPTAATASVLVSLSEVAAGRLTGSQLDPAVRGMICLHRDLTPPGESDQRRIAQHAAQVLDRAELPSPEKARLSARLADLRGVP